MSENLILKRIKCPNCNFKIVFFDFNISTPFLITIYKKTLRNVLLRNNSYVIYQRFHCHSKHTASTTQKSMLRNKRLFFDYVITIITSFLTQSLQHFKSKIRSEIFEKLTCHAFIINQIEN